MAAPGRPTDRSRLQAAGDRRRRYDGRGQSDNDLHRLVSDAVDDAVDAEGNRALAPTAVAVLTHIVTSIVDDPAAVTTLPPVAGGCASTCVGPGDLGRVIGRRGRTAQSIRTVVRAAASRDDTDVDVEFLDD